MKDTQIKAGSDLTIPVISPFLHCVAMTVIVFVRSSFGFRYLGPKSVFFAFTWAFVLFTVYAWNEPEVWREYRAACIYGVAAATLYWLHLLVAFIQECREKGRHDRYSGNSHAALLLRRNPPWRQVEKVKLWVEPAAVFVAALALHWLFHERHLSAWLVFAGLCFWVKEAMNFWIGLRHFKAQKDMLEDAESMAEEATPTASEHGPPKATRKEPVKKKRNFAAAGKASEERRHAEILHLREPYTLAGAEENYRRLIVQEHPDTHANSPESNAVTAKLNEAIEFFRERFRP